jgi:hypothetical protein
MTDYAAADPVPRKGSKRRPKQNAEAVPVPSRDGLARAPPKKRHRRPKLIVERRIGGSYSLDEWLALRGISHTLVYQLWAKGIGPRRTRIGGRIFITDESDQEFIARNTEPAPVAV